jgi:1,4-alpha-glucan branching enzyme
MVDLAKANAAVLKKNASRGPRRPLARALHQAARELLLAESSDWPFILKTGTMVPYAKKRIAMHIGRFTKLHDDIQNNTIDESWLGEVERRDTIFADMPCARYYLLDNQKKKSKVSLTSKKRTSGKKKPPKRKYE